MRRGWEASMPHFLLCYVQMKIIYPCWRYNYFGKSGGQGFTLCHCPLLHAISFDRFVTQAKLISIHSVYIKKQRSGSSR